MDTTKEKKPVATPDGATGALATREDGTPLIVATDDTALFTIECVISGAELSPGFADCRAIRLDPSRDSVARRMGWRRPMGSVIRMTTWRFRVADLSFEVKTEYDEGELADDKAEMFAQRLGAALSGSSASEVPNLKAAA